VSEIGRFALHAFGLSLSADGIVALGLAIPVTLLLLAIAYRIVRPARKLPGP